MSQVGGVDAGGDAPADAHIFQLIKRSVQVGRGEDNKSGVLFFDHLLHVLAGDLEIGSNRGGLRGTYDADNVVAQLRVFLQPTDKPAEVGFGPDGDRTPPADAVPVAEPSYSRMDERPDENIENRRDECCKPEEESAIEAIPDKEEDAQDDGKSVDVRPAGAECPAHKRRGCDRPIATDARGECDKQNDRKEEEAAIRLENARE